MSNNYVKGQWLAICDICGFKFHSGKLRKTWEGYMACSGCWEPRHPQDMIKAKKDDSSVPWTRPESTDVETDISGWQIGVSRVALSASTNFSVNRDQMITASLRVLSVIGQGRSATTSEVNDASQALNMVLKLLHGDGMPLWLVRNESITLTASTTSYTLGPSGDVVMDRPTFITHATLRKTSDTTDTDLNIIPQTDYLLLSDKTETGTPNSVYYDPQLTNGVLYMWPTADTARHNAPRSRPTSTKSLKWPAWRDASCRLSVKDRSFCACNGKVPSRRR